MYHARVHLQYFEVLRGNTERSTENFGIHCSYCSGSQCWRNVTPRQRRRRLVSLNTTLKPRSEGQPADDIQVHKIDNSEINNNSDNHFAQFGDVRAACLLCDSLFGHSPDLLHKATKGKFACNFVFCFSFGLGNWVCLSIVGCLWCASWKNWKLLGKEMMG